jgi:hypothetical protein
VVKQQLYIGLSSRIVRQFAAVITAAVVLLLFNFNAIHAFYFANQPVDIGILINAGIIALFVVGLGNILFHLLRYQSEEAVVARFVGNVESLNKNLTDGLPVNSVLAVRYATMRTIQANDGEIDHSALSSMLTADEATRLGVVRFINNILILSGVFGTIVSLAIALLGVSDLLESASGSSAGIGLVIFGMSTALSTTITAITSYVLFSYFYIRLLDVQNRLLSIVEYLTSVYLLPLSVHSADDIAQQIESLIKSLDSALLNLTMTQEIFLDSTKTLHQAIVSKRQQIEGLDIAIEATRQILLDGFRLPTDERVTGGQAKSGHP